MQLQQWFIWPRELQLHSPLARDLDNRCLAALHGQQTPPSQLQHNVVDALRKLHAHVEEKFVMDEGYSIDALVLWQGEHFAVEVDGPSHFLKRQDGFSPNGPTMLKRRQLRSLAEGRWHLVTVPYCEWDRLANSADRHEYPSQKLKP